MKIKLSSRSRLKLSGRLSNGTAVPQALAGQIFRVVNALGSVNDSLDYTKIDGSPANTGTITSGSIVYIVAQSNTLVDSIGGDQGQLVITNLLITVTSDETPTFTEELITTSGAGTWTKPNGVTQVIVECWGGGGAGGGASTNDTGGGGGASGQYARKLIQYDSAETSVPYVIAASVAGGTGPGATGEDTTWDTNIVVAKGGQGGEANVQPSFGGVASTDNGIGDVVYTGLSGQEGFFSNPFAIGGGGGEGAGSADAGAFLVPGRFEYGGAETENIQLSSGGSNGTPGNNYAGGGGGAVKISGPNRSGGAGAQGLIRLIYR